MHRSIELLVRGLIAGFLIAAPVGPVNVLCLSRTLSKGWPSGVVSGVGAAAADTLYGAIAGFSITFVIQLLIREEFWIRLIGGMLLVALGVFYYRKRPQPLAARKCDKAERSDFASTFLLNLTNPTTVLSFLAVLAALGMDGAREWWLTAFLVFGIFCGSMAWWLVLTGVVHSVRGRFNDRAMVWMNRIAGLAIGGFGLLMILLSRRQS